MQKQGRIEFYDKKILCDSDSDIECEYRITFPHSKVDFGISKIELKTSNLNRRVESKVWDAVASSVIRKTLNFV